MTNTHHFVDRIAPDLARCWLLVLQRDVIEATTDQVKAIHAAAQREVLRQLLVIQVVAVNQNRWRSRVKIQQSHEAKTKLFNVPK